MNIALFDYGAGNLHSLAKALEASGANVLTTSDWTEALDVDGLVLPGVGAFGQAAKALPADRARLLDTLARGYPCLGICLGMQLFFDSSEESFGAGIGIVPGRVERMDAEIVPHMGWNDVDITDDPVFDGVGSLVAYYANSYICVPANEASAIAWSTCDSGPFTAAVRVANTWGVQFHPEKSSIDGRRIIDNFVALTREVTG